MLQSKAVHIQKLFDEYNTGVIRDRSQLLGPTGVSSWVSDDDVQSTSQYTVDQLRDQQKEMLKDQDEGLENLSKIISRQKNIAQSISNEVDVHNEIIGDLGEHIDRTDARVVNETRAIVRIDRKDRTCIYWVIIILLFISIIVVASLPKL